VLGAAAGGGFPQWNCGCRNCSLARQGDERARPRTQSGLAVSADGRAWILLNASPDLGAQMRATPALWPETGELRHSPIAAVVLTSADIDQIAGLLNLREGHAFDLVALEPVQAVLAANPVFGVLAGARRVIAQPGQPVRLGGLEIELFPVSGKAPLYEEGDDSRLGSEAGEVCGVLVRSDGRTLAYVPGCAEITPDLRERLVAADAVLFDGTLYTDDEMIRMGAGVKTGRRMGHVPVSGEGGSLSFLSGLPGRKIYVHINNTNPILIEGSGEHRAVRDAGVEIGWDGMEIVL
jgi:pyrroloquinoline quinone biosynthesis protein B